MERWTLLRKGADFAGIAKKYGISPRLACLIRNRDVVEEEEIRQYLYGTLEDLPSPWLLKDMKKTVACILKKIREKKKIRIFPD